MDAAKIELETPRNVATFGTLYAKRHERSLACPTRLEQDQRPDRTLGSAVFATLSRNAGQLRITDNEHNAKAFDASVERGDTLIAYIVNQYPKVSHSFIRREIRALESKGVAVARFALRGWDADLADDADFAERKATSYLLKDGPAPLLASALLRALRRPVSTLAALRQTFRMLSGSDRSAFRHVVTFLEACNLADRIEAAGVSHIHAHFGTNSAEVAMLASLASGVSYSFTVHGPEEFDKPESIRLRDKVRNARFVVAISSFCASQIYRWIEIDDWCKVKVIRCGVDASFLKSAPAEPVANTTFVCVARLSAQKGHLLLLDAAAMLLRRGVSFDLVFVGDGEMRATIESAIDARGLRGNVRITGWVSGDAVRDEILAARAMILPSFGEGLPIVLMEAMALGKVVLATRIAAVGELVRHGESGWLFSPGSAEDAAEAMQACLNASCATLAEMGAAGRRTVLERHDVDRETTALRNLFVTGVAADAQATAMEEAAGT